MADEETKPKMISITVKTPKDKHVVEVEEDASIKDVSTYSWHFQLITITLSAIKRVDVRSNEHLRNSIPPRLIKIIHQSNFFSDVRLNYSLIFLLLI